MPTYQFRIDDGECEFDEGGVVLADDVAARAESVRLAGDMLRFDTIKVLRNRLVRVKVFDERKHQLFLVTVLASDAHAR